MAKYIYFLIFFVIWYVLNGIVLTYVFKKPDMWDERAPSYLRCLYEEEHDTRSSLEKCGGDICPGPACWPPEVDPFMFFLRRDTYRFTITWPVWVVDEVVWPEVYSGETRTTKRILFGHHS